MKKYFLLIVLLPLFLSAQEPKENLGDKEYIIIKDYKPVLAESYKISDTPEGDTTTADNVTMNYTIRSKKAETDYETATIKAVKIKDEPLPKLYRSYIVLGIGNYSTYNGELYVNSLRSRKGALNFNLKHFSSDPGLDDAGPAGFSNNSAGINGRYFLDHATFTGDFNYDRNVLHYYGYNTNDTIIDKSNIKQRFNRFGVRLGMASNYANKDHLDYSGVFGFKTVSDIYGVSENNFRVEGNVGKQVDTKYIYGGLSFDFWKKSNADYELLTNFSNLSRDIVSFAPGLRFDQDKVKLDLGLTISLEKNLDNSVHLFPRVNLTLPIAENILYAFAGVNGGIVKQNYNSVTQENPFVTSSILIYKNTVNKLEMKAGLKGNFSSTVNFLAQVKYTNVGSMLLYEADRINFNKFNSLFLDGKVFNLHAELGYKSTEKVSATLRFDQYSYSMSFNEKAWQRPNTEVALNLNYSLQEKLLLKASIYGRGSFFVRDTQPNGGYIAQKVKGFMDGNLGIEYRYSKILSIYVNLNNLGFTRYYYWYQYPTERLNAIGGLTYAF